MKRFIVFLILIMTLSVLYFTNVKVDEVFDDYDGDYVCYYMGDINEEENFNVVKNGQCKMIKSKSFFRNQLLSKLDQNLIVGESIKINSKNVESVIDDLGVIVNSEKVYENIKVFEGTISGINNYVYTKNKKTNVQIALSNDGITIGIPIIFGSY